MALDVGRALKNPGQGYPFHTSVQLPQMDVLGDPVRFEDIRLEGEFFGTGHDRISVRADVRAEVHSRCSRCLKPVQMTLDSSVDGVYARECDPDDPDLYLFEGHTLELEDAVRDALLLDLPLQLLCKADCKGLCPVCGSDLNQQTCTCQEGNVVTGPFSALKDHVLKNEEV